MRKRVFISHTSLLARHPANNTFLAAAITGAKEANWEPVQMDRFPSSSRTPAEECREQVLPCDAFIGVLGFDWGSELPGIPGMSYTMYEFDVAKHGRKPTLLFIIDEGSKDFPIGEITSISPSDLAKQTAFRDLHGLHARRVRTPGDLTRKVRAALEALDSRERVKLVIQTYEGFIATADYVSAWQHFRDHLNYTLDFELNEHAKHLELLERLFPQPDIFSNPYHINDFAVAVNALARAYKNVGQPGKAIEIYRRGLELERTDPLHRVMALGNLANALRLTGNFTAAQRAARQMAEEASNVRDPKWKAYSLYWNGVLQAGNGLAGESVLLLRQAQVLFEDLHDHQESAAGLGRTYAHLAQLELWLQNPRGALCFARHAYRLAETHNERRESIFAARLAGTAKTQLTQYANDLEDLKNAISDAKGCDYWEEWLAATIALAEQVQRSGSGSLTTALSILSDDARIRAQQGPYAMLLADFNIALCRILRMSGGGEGASEANIAFEAALGVHSDVHYHWGIVRARKHLMDLGEHPARVPSHPVLESSPSLAELLRMNGGQKTRAALRAELTKLLRMVTGNYRYAPAKFVRLLRESWSDIRSVVEDRAVNVSPQFVEIHLGHPCNLNCQYCRGTLREKPANEVFLPKEQISRVLEDIYRMNPRAFVRFSGVIGEPLLHPDIVDILEPMAREHATCFALTTNGVRLKGPRLLKALLRSKYVHISVDAGNKDDYRTLKGGGADTFGVVMQNVETFARARDNSASNAEIVVSFLIQQENFAELPELAQRLKAAKVNSLEIKMQHFDARRRMRQTTVDDAYQVVEDVQRDLSDETFHVIVVQSRDQALEKASDSQPVRFPKCYANLLGMSTTVDPAGNVQMCCQYYQRTLGSIGNIADDNFAQVWTGTQRVAALERKPCDHCQSCSPSDEFINRFVHFLKESIGKDPSFLDWVEREVTPLMEDGIND